jgi:5'-3' exonuclease
MIAIIDGDVLCYQACLPRWEKKARIQDGFNYISLDEHGKKIPLEYTKEEDREYLEQSWERLKKDLQELLDTVFCTEYLMAVKGPGNYRNLMYPEYKLNRHADPTKQNMFVPVLRKLAVHEDLAIESDGREADDLMRIWAEQAMAAGDDYIICSIDKDLKCIPGKHYLMHKDKKHTIVVSPEEAMRHYYEQLLKGDPTDNIPGVPRVGDVKATKLLAPFSTEEEFQAQVVEQYLIAYGEDLWKDYLLSNAKMIHLQKNANDYFSFDNWPIVRELTYGI